MKKECTGNLKEIILAMIEAGATRIGTSSGVKICS